MDEIGPLRKTSSLRSEHYRLLVEQLSDFAIFMLDPEGRITSWNAGARRILGYDEAEIIGQPFVVIFTPEDVEAGLPGRELAKAANEGRADDDRWHIRKDGSRFWASGSTTAYYGRAGRLIGFAKIVRDGTEKRRVNEAMRESEARYRLLADFVPQMEWSAGPSGQLDYFNRRWLDYTGLTSEQAQGGAWGLILHPDDLPQAFDRWNQAVKTGEPFEAEYRVRRADGVYRWHLGRAVAAKDDARRVIRWFGTCTDIHDQKQAEAERALLLESEKAARAEAEAANRVKDEFLAVLSHELRSPLTAVLGWVNILKVGSHTQAELQEGLDVIERGTSAQARLIDDLLDVSRIVAGKLLLDVKPVQLAPVIQAAAAAVRVAADAKGISLSLDLDPAVGAVHGDADRLQQVVWNLLSNAVKFTPKGGTVSVKLELLHSQVQVRVADTGPGIAPDLLPHVFERFSQSENARRLGGLGLGLAIVRHLVEQHGGTVTAESGGEGQGAVLTVTLPLLALRHDQVETLIPQPKDTAKPAGATGRDLSGVSVLVVEDEAMPRRAIVKLLTACNAKARSAGSAGEAMAEIQKTRPDVIVCDVGLPDENGYELMRRIRALPSEQGGRVPAVALTGYASLDDRRQALEAGFQMHLAKPVTLAELAAVVANLANKAPSAE